MHTCPHAHKIHAHMRTCIHAYGGPQSTKNPSKIDPTRDPKEDAILTATWEALGLIFNGFWLQNGSVWDVLRP